MGRSASPFIWAKEQPEQSMLGAEPALPAQPDPGRSVACPNSEIAACYHAAAHADGTVLKDRAHDLGEI